MKIGILEFFGQVKQEMAKVTWSTRKEVTTSTIMVVVMVAIFSMFFLVVDIVVHNVMQAILKIGG